VRTDNSKKELHAAAADSAFEPETSDSNLPKVVQSALPTSPENKRPHSRTGNPGDAVEVHSGERPAPARTAVIMDSTGEIEAQVAAGSAFTHTRPRNSGIEAHIVSSEGKIEPLIPAALVALDDGDMAATVSMQVEAAVDRPAAMKSANDISEDVVSMQYPQMPQPAIGDSAQANTTGQNPQIAPMPTSPMPTYAAAAPAVQVEKVTMPKDNESGGLTLSTLLVILLLCMILVIVSLALGVTMELTHRLGTKSGSGKRSSLKRGTVKFHAYAPTGDAHYSDLVSDGTDNQVSSEHYPIHNGRSKKRHDSGHRMESSRTEAASRRNSGILSPYSSAQTEGSKIDYLSASAERLTRLSGIFQKPSRASLSARGDTTSSLASEVRNAKLSPEQAPES
jgi:hypothetical protein